jgi:protein-ribulosamine 3-kinase
MTDRLYRHLAARIQREHEPGFQFQRVTSLGGGCINTAMRLHGENSSYFVKLNRADRLPMFEAEFEGLQELAAARAVRVPRPIACGADQGQAYLLLEYIPLSGAEDNTRECLGTALAALHRRRWQSFGWRLDNTIGATPQPNDPHRSWLEFWRDRRLGHQLGLAAQRGIGSHALDLGERLQADLPRFFHGYAPVPSLLHGDLWGGNFAADPEGGPVIFDPAVYYGDREADIAMTELFGGFGRRFMDAYHEAWPLDPGYPLRRDLYNLYHVLNHYVLFGGGYGRQAAAMMNALLGEL